MNIFARQGDVYLFETVIPVEAVKVEPNESERHVLAYGEITGHAHAIYDLKKVEIYMLEQGGVTKQYIKAIKDVKLLHGAWKGKGGDHAIVTIPKGKTMEVVIQREYNYWTDSPERVKD
jgi:hypothetical protein